jgi:DNA modification methylase
MNDVIKQIVNDKFSLYNGDCIPIVGNLPDESVDYSVFSPPFASLYTYSDSINDMGNCRNEDEFYRQFKFLVKELFRVTKAGRLVSFHCMNIPAMKERDGYIGIKDFRGHLIRMFQEEGFIYASEVCIWKDPLIEAVRTKALGLMHKQLCKDSAMSRQGLPDYVITMRKPGENKDLIEHENGLLTYAGEGDLPEGNPSHNTWRKYASPVWMDIRQTYTLNYRIARDGKDERHICPLQLDTIERCITLWSRPGDVVLSPFAGIGSEIYQAVKMGRYGIGVELKESYYDCAVDNCNDAAGIEKIGFM